MQSAVLATLPLWLVKPNQYQINGLQADLVVVEDQGEAKPQPLHQPQQKTKSLCHQQQPL